MILFSATMNPFNLLLTILAVISIGTGDKATFTVMLLMVVLSTGLRYLLCFIHLPLVSACSFFSFANRFWQELKSMSKAAALVNAVTIRVRVLRAHSGPDSAAATSEEVEIDRKQVVPGDVLAVASTFLPFLNLILSNHLVPLIFKKIKINK